MEKQSVKMSARHAAMCSAHPDSKMEHNELTPEQAVTVIRSIQRVLVGASSASVALAMDGLGESALCARFDALESEMMALLAGLKPALCFE